MGGQDIDCLGTVLNQGMGHPHQCTPRRDEIVDHHRVHPVDFTNDVEDFGDVVTGAPLVDDGEGGVHDLGHGAGTPGSADVWGDHDDVVVVPVADVLGDDLDRREVVEGDVEEALDGVGVEVERNDAVGPR